MKLRKYASPLLAICISLILILVAGMSVRIIYNYERINISHNLITRLDATKDLVNLWQRNYRSSVQALADDPSLISLVDDLLSNKISNADASAAMQKWLRPIYLSRGYDGHSIITSNYTIILSSSPSYTGKAVVSPISRKLIAHAMENNTDISQVIEAQYQITMRDKLAAAGTLFQLGCARINLRSNSIAALCLRQNPYENFFTLLNTGFSGATGEAYAINHEGYIITPTRFGQQFIHKHTKPFTTSSYVKELQARVPHNAASREKTTHEGALTQAVSMAFQKGSSGFIDGYQDYRGVNVVGTAIWLPDLDMGIVIEQDASEVYAPYQFYRDAIIGFTLFAIALINILMMVMVRSRKVIAKREQLMRTFLDNFPGLAHMRDREGKFIIINTALEKTLNLPRREILGRSTDVLNTPSKHIRQFNHEHHEVLRTGEILESIQEVSEINFYEAQWIKTIRFPIFNPDTHAVDGVGNIVLDITEQTRTAQELDAIRIELEQRVADRTEKLDIAKLEAEQAAQIKADFLANMSHEIRTPMNAIIGLSHLASLVSDDPKLRSYLERINQSSTHLLSIINNILDFSKIEAGKMALENSEFSLEDMLDNVLRLLEDKAQEKNLELLLQIDADIPDRLRGDVLRIGQILINFTSNAVKFTQAGHVLIRVRKITKNAKNISIRFEVHDTGIGISHEQFSQLFTPFHQLDSSVTRRFEGTGLGLTISKNLAELMGSEIIINSQVNIGSTFAFELNLTHQTPQDTFQHYSLAFKDKRVLVVDNNPTARDILCSTLSIMNLNVSSADSGKAAIALINTQTQAYDIILLDAYMPTLSGIETAEHINAMSNAHSSKLILLSPYNKHDIALDHDKLFAAIINKPTLPSVLQDTLVKLIKNTQIRPNHNEQLDLTIYRQLTGSRVLLVDDNAVNQDVVKELLTLINIEVITANNGQEAIEYLKQESVDIVLMDVQMPVMDGIAATRHLRAQECFDNLPIIAMTAGVLASDRERCLSSGMNDYISKPIYPEILFRILLRWHTQRTPAQPQAVSTLIDPKATLHTKLIAQLYCVDGLEVDQALERLLNNEELYIKLLKRFIQERSDFVDIIEAELAEKNIAAASFQAHSFKSLTATIGANQLYVLALQMEKDLHAEKDISALLPTMRIALDNFIAELQMSLEA